MAKHIHKCGSCQLYTLHEACPKCQGKTIIPKPPKFSLNDKYSSYRRESKKEEFAEKGFL